MATGAENIGSIRPPTPIEASAVVATIGEARQTIYDRALQRILGQQLQGQVLSRFTDGSFLVKVADTAARVALPSGAQVGDSLSLTLISLQPRPTFLLGGGPGSGAASGKSPPAEVDLHNIVLQDRDDSEPPPAASKSPLVYLKQQSTPQATLQTDPRLGDANTGRTNAAQATNAGGTDNTATGTGNATGNASSTASAGNPSTLGTAANAANTGTPAAPSNANTPPPGTTANTANGDDLATASVGNTSGTSKLTDTAIQPDGALPGTIPTKTETVTKTAPTIQQPATALPPGTTKDSTPATLSTAGRLINNLLQAAQQQGAPSALLGKNAIVQTPATLPLQVALALKDTLAYSGLFYESHVVEWADGKRPIAELLREPQMQAQAAASPNKGPQAQDGEVQFSQLVNLQLNVLEQDSMQWSGEIWPGQKMNWDVRKDPDQNKGHAGDEPAQQTWQSGVRFNLPLLGSVSATIHLIGERLHIQINTGAETTAATLREHADALVDALAAAGSPLDSLLVKQDDQA
jgi:hypothetical protein